VPSISPELALAWAYKNAGAERNAISKSMNI